MCQSKTGDDVTGWDCSPSAPNLVAGRRWTPSAATEQAEAAHHHPGTRPVHPKDACSWCRENGGKRTLTARQKPFAQAERGQRGRKESGRGNGEYLPARSIGCGSIQSELHHQGGPWCPPVSQEPEPMVWRRLHVLILSDSRHTGTPP